MQGPKSPENKKHIDTDTLSESNETRKSTNPQHIQNKNLPEKRTLSEALMTAKCHEIKISTMVLPLEDDFPKIFLPLNLRRRSFLKNESGDALSSVGFLVISGCRGSVILSKYDVRKGIFLFLSWKNASSSEAARALVFILCCRGTRMRRLIRQDFVDYLPR